MQHVLKCSKFPCYLNISNDLLGVLKRLTYTEGFTTIMCFLMVKLYHSRKSTADQSIACAWTIFSFFSVPWLLLFIFSEIYEVKEECHVETCPFLYLYACIIDRTMYLIYMKFTKGLFYKKLLTKHGLCENVWVGHTLLRAVNEFPSAFHIYCLIWVHSVTEICTLCCWTEFLGSWGREGCTFLLGLVMELNAQCDMQYTRN